MKFTIENIAAHNKAQDEFNNHWDDLFQSIAQAIVDHPTEFTYITDKDSVTHIDVSVYGEGDERKVHISFRDQYSDREELIVPAIALDHPGGIAGYENERIAAEKAAQARKVAEREANQQRSNRADMLETIGRAMAMHDFTNEELAAAVVKARAE